MSVSIAAIAAMLLSGAVADDHRDHGCTERPHGDGAYCECSREVTFYTPWTPGPAIHLRAPGVRVYGRPIEVAGPTVHISGPPVYVDAPPIRVRPAQIYIERPDVRVRPSEIIVEPPEVHFSGCPDGSGSCPAGRD